MRSWPKLQQNSNALTSLVKAPSFVRIWSCIDYYFRRVGTLSEGDEKESIADATQNFVASYGSRSFYPHVTLGTATQATADEIANNAEHSLRKQLPLSWSLFESKLAICQLGANCTCRKVLW